MLDRNFIILYILLLYIFERDKRMNQLFKNKKTLMVFYIHNDPLTAYLENRIFSVTFVLMT